MIIELRGVEFVNKGAQLMLYAILDKVKREIADAKFVMEPGARAPLGKLRKHNIYVKLNGRKSAKLGKLMPRPLRRSLGLVLDKEVQVILDGSGFALGDAWGAEYAERRLGAKVIRWKQQGKRIILLPQAFGPFSEPALREVMSKILYHSDLVFAREPRSYEYLQEFNGGAGVQLAPDFTNLLSGSLPAGFDPGEHQVAIVPNYKMISHCVQEDGYLDFLCAAVESVRENNLKPYFLIHEGERDKAIAEKANALLELPVAIVSDDDPLHIKGIISSAYFLICSRFHGVVSALSQGVPCLVTSWSHKYEMLLREYDFEEGLIPDLSNLEQLRTMIGRLSDPWVNRSVSARLREKSKLEKERSQAMWQRVFEILRNEQ